MENKILVRLFVPMLESEYEVFLPISKKMGEIILLLGKAITDISNEAYKVKGSERLYSKESGKEYDQKQILKMTDIRNGSQIIYL